MFKFLNPHKTSVRFTEEAKDVSTERKYTWKPLQIFFSLVEDGIVLANGKRLQESINGASCRKLMAENNKINFIQLCTSSDIDVDPRFSIFSKLG
jgi:hypothetical protein